MVRRGYMYTCYATGVQLLQGSSDRYLPTMLGTNRHMHAQSASTSALSHGERGLGTRLDDTITMLE